MVFQVQLGKMTKPLGGAFIHMGYPLFPMFGDYEDTPIVTKYTGTDPDNKFYIFYGQSDLEFPGEEATNLTL